MLLECRKKYFINISYRIIGNDSTFKKGITKNALELYYLIYLKSRMRLALLYKIGKVRSKNTFLQQFISVK